MNVKKTVFTIGLMSIISAGSIFAGGDNWKWKKDMDTGYLLLATPAAVGAWHLGKEWRKPTRYNFSPAPDINFRYNYLKALTKSYIALGGIFLVKGLYDSFAVEKATYDAIEKRIEAKHWKSKK